MWENQQPKLYCNLSSPQRIQVGSVGFLFFALGLQGKTSLFFCVVFYGNLTALNEVTSGVSSNIDFVVMAFGCLVSIIFQNGPDMY